MAALGRTNLIGPIFNAAVTDWDHHIGKISDFWSSIMRAGRRGLSRCRGDVTRSAFVLQASNGRAVPLHQLAVGVRGNSGSKQRIADI